MPIGIGVKARRCESLADSSNDRSSRVHRSATLADDDALPLVEQLVGPHPIEEPILREGEQHVHDREWEELIGVDEHPIDASH